MAMTASEYGTAESAPPVSDALVLRRPHFRRVGDALYFMISRRPYADLSPSESKVWDALQVDASVEALRNQFPDCADSAVRRFLVLGVCEMVAGKVATSRRKVMVLEPHSDDAVLSVGGTMWARREQCRFSIVTIAGRSNFTSYQHLHRDFFDVGKVCALRDAEGALVARMLGGAYINLGLDESNLRYRDGDWNVDWYRRHEYSVRSSIGRCYPEAVFREWTEAVAGVLRRSDDEEIWIPLGVGTHSDHQMARDACLAAVVADPSLIADRAVRLYEEVPYALYDPSYPSALASALNLCGAVLERQTSRIDEVIDHKLRLVSIYASQFKLDYMGPRVVECARHSSGGNGLAEVMWSLRKPPAMLNRSSLYYDRDAVEGLAARVKNWARRFRDTRRLRVLLLLPSGRWAEDVADLLDAFPLAAIEVYTTPAGLAEVEAVASPRVTAHAVGSGAAAWAVLAAKLAISRPAPTLFLAGRKRFRAASAMARLWPLSRPIVASSVDHILLALRS
jgi:LmbE family N-acetylglucosaminyl deacetylase